jgi:hypothetical protein
MTPMNAVRWVLVVLLYVAAELSSPLMLTPLETFDGEAEESIHLVGRARAGRLAVARRKPVTGDARAALRRSRPRPVSAVTRSPSTRKVPAPVPESESAPEAD